MNYKEILREKVKEKGIVDMIIDYTKQMNNVILKENYEELGVLYKKCRFFRSAEPNREQIRIDFFIYSCLLKEEIREYNEIIEKENEYNRLSLKLLID